MLRPSYLDLFSASCGIDGKDGTFIIIGGHNKDNEKRVTMYRYQYNYGLPSQQLPNLNQGRRYHSCTHVYMRGTLVGNIC